MNKKLNFFLSVLIILGTVLSLLIVALPSNTQEMINSWFENKEVATRTLIKQSPELKTTGPATSGSNFSQ
jgi:hypothetical protein